MSLLIPTFQAMENFGAQIARTCHTRSIVVYLVGELGTGKTTLVRGFLHALGYTGLVKSPTYTLVEAYQTAAYLVYHFDLYRLSHPEELGYLGIRDYLEDHVICLIEWPERGGYATPPPDITIQLFHHREARLLELQAHTEGGQTILQQLGPV